MWTGYVAGMRETRLVYEMFEMNQKEETNWEARFRWENNTFGQVGCEIMDWIHLV